MTRKYFLLIIILASICLQTYGQADSKKTSIMNKSKQLNLLDHSKKSILARGCDPIMSINASKAIPPLIGNPKYIPTTSDNDFIEQLESQKWSVVFFAPGACRYNAADQPIPGGNSKTLDWTLEQYRELVWKTQGDQVQIVETQDERETVQLLKDALEKARDIN